MISRRATLRMVAIWVVGGAAALQAQGSAAGITREQIEADYLLQAKLRLPVLARGGIAAEQADVTREQDAAGAVDGLINGKWGFHTLHEKNPWWCVDLGESLPLARVVLYNRCDSCGPRNNRIELLLGEADGELALAYTHDGTPFAGHTDKKPLVVELNGRRSRYVRLQLTATEYFHLDEVQVYAVGSKENVALGKPATQSSVSRWSALPAGVAAASTKPATSQWTGIMRVTLQNGQRLAEALQLQGVNVRADSATLAGIAAQVDATATERTTAQWQRLYLDARWAIRRMALGNPLLDFDSVLFVKRAPTMFPHLSDQYYGWWSRPGGGVFVLKDFKTDTSTVRCLSTGFADGNFLRPDLDYDGRKLVVAHSRHYPHVPAVPNKLDKAALPEDAFYHIYEIDLAPADGGAEPRRLTRGRYDDFDARYLPDGDIAFLSTRKGDFIQCSRENTQRTNESDLPDSYVRCGGGNYRPVPVFTLHRMEGTGSDMRPISAFETFEYTPSVANDGRILYCRWDYIDRFNGHFFSLWSTNQDGSNAQLVYGNYTKRPQATMEPRAIPGSTKIIFTASAHHSITGGSLVLLDRNRGLEKDAPITRLTPEVPFPETERNVGMFYANPWPLSEDVYLVSWSNQRLPGHRRDASDKNPVNAQGLYLYDRFGNLDLIYRDASISSMSPIPLRPRPRPGVHPEAGRDDQEQVGTLLIQDTYRGLAGVAPGTVKRLRIVGVPPKVQPHMNRPVLGVSREETGKYILGSVPVEADGSAQVRVPSGVPYFFQALDAEGRAVQTMRSLTYVQPQQTLSCIGCHEHRDAAPASRGMPLAATKPPAKITPGPAGSLLLRYDLMVQPVLDQHCIGCHAPNSGTPKAAKIALASPASWDTLIGYADGDLKRLVFERDASPVGNGPSLDSKLIRHLQTHPGHKRIKLLASDWRRIYAWMDTYAHRQGCFSAQQEKDLLAWRETIRELFSAPP